MNNHFLEKLLDGAEVEWKELGEVTLPTSNIRWQDTTKTYCYIDLTSVSRENKTIIETTEISAKTAPSRAKKLVEKNDVIFATTRPTQQRFTLIDGYYSGSIASTGYCVLRANTEEVLPKWIYYHISTLAFNNYLEEHQSGSAYPAISDAKVKKFKIPVPKELTVQTEIVRILDTFTALTAELTAELNMRDKQYKHYLDRLLNFNNINNLDSEGG